MHCTCVVAAIKFIHVAHRWKKSSTSGTGREIAHRHSKLNNGKHSFVRHRSRRLVVEKTKRVALGEDPVHKDTKKKEDEKQALRVSIRSLPRKQIKNGPERLILPKILKDNADSFEVSTFYISISQIISLVQVKQARYAPPLRQLSKSPIHRVSGLFVSLFGKAAVDELPNKWSSTYKSIKKLSKIMDSNEQLPGARVYNTRIFDIVVDNKHIKPREKIYVPPFLKEAFDIVNSFNDADNVRILSPRIIPILPDKASKRFLSPSLFPFYKDDTEQSILPIPRVLRTAGLNEKDRERILEMIMEVSGARETVDKAVKVPTRLFAAQSNSRNFDNLARKCEKNLDVGRVSPTWIAT
ncbi:hypothetical protein Y032_0042g676 [Ancylostoma ceylanicum]|uniref:Uncharacterized protein n=1 Tax=Ancylostoma ceylanicum TaxID=53326 RepID=A0A016UFZ1_9BILA|nr:hypothetical protein Y032_0042g676 [Ancylostoma ceylanicum]